jgi:phosphoribosylglycinamide formyltransferase-1
MAVRCVVLASGRGSNFTAIAEAVRSGHVPGLDIIALVTHNEKAEALNRARDFEIPTVILSESDRDRYHIRLLETLRELNPDWICLAGYLRLLPPGIIDAFPMKIINIHPSLLPAFPGLRAQRQALTSGVRYTGCTVHLVTAEMDKGPIVDQSVCEIQPADTEESLSQRLLPIEHATYVRALARLVSKPHEVRANRIVWK